MQERDKLIYRLILKKQVKMKEPLKTKSSAKEEKNKKEDMTMRLTIAEALGIAEQLIGVVAEAVKKVFKQEVDLKDLQLEVPPKPELGDVAMPCFLMAKQLKQSPATIAEKLATSIKPFGLVSSISSVGPYINFSFTKGKVIAEVCGKIVEQGENYGQSKLGAGKRVMIEYSGPNSNKALHLGHLRNNQIGLSLVNIFRAAGYEVIPVNIINDRGIAICRSMVAYKKWADGATPESKGIKGDHFVGQLYAQFMEVRDKEFAQWLQTKKKLTMDSFKSLSEERQDEIVKEFEAQSPLVQESYDMLRKWEAKDPEVRKLWQTMNDWVYKGFNQTYARQGVSFDKVYLESNTYELGRQIVHQYLKQGMVERDADNNIVIDLSAHGLDKKVLIRADGTTVYITQDIGTAVLRFQEYDPLDQLIYVVASEQNYHFQVLFLMLKAFGYPWADRCFHRSYGMVNLPTGKLSSRRLKEGGIFLADDLMDHLHQLAREGILQREPNLSGEPLEQRAEMIGQAALKYFLLRVNPDRNMIFEPEKSLEFEGNTGPYLQYAHARICGILRKSTASTEKANLSILDSPEELELAKALASFPQTIESATKDYNPTVVAAHLYEIAKVFSQFYNQHRILGSKPEIEKARLLLAKATAIVLKNGLRLLGIKAPERM